MTREELLKAFEMRMDGASYPEIGAKLYLHCDTVRNGLYEALNAKRRKRVIHSNARPKLAEHITKKYDGVVKRFSEKSGVSQTTLSIALKGGRLTQRTIDKIRAVAGNIV